MTFLFLVPNLSFFSHVPRNVLKSSVFSKNLALKVLQQVGDFFFWSKSSFSGGVGGIKFEFWWGVLIFD